MRRVGIRELRDNATKLLAGEEVLAIERHGRLVGYFVPVRVQDEPGMRGAMIRLERELEKFREPAGELLRRHRRKILDAARRHGATNVRVFGSAARGDATPASDIDLLVELEAGRSLLDLSGLLVDLQKLLGRRVDIVTPGGMDDRMRESVLAEAVPL